MARYKVYHIVRDGHVERDVIYARSSHQAMKEARQKYDDVLKVRRDKSLPLPVVLLMAAVIVIVLCIVSR